METDRIHKDVGCLALVAGRESDLFSMEEVSREVFQQIDAVRLSESSKATIGTCRTSSSREFTVQQNKLYMLQTRTGKRTAATL